MNETTSGTGDPELNQLLCLPKGSPLAMKNLVKILTILFLLSPIAGCYHINIQQGNIITPRDVKAIHRGMTEQAVIDAIGSPILVNIYADHRKVYVYTFQPGGKKISQRHLIIYFYQGRVTSFDTNVSEAEHSL